MLTQSLPRPNNLYPLMALFILVAVTVSAGFVIKDHALKHTLGTTLLNCSDDQLGLIVFNPQTGREARVCEFRPGEWGELISEGKEVFHAFANSKSARFNQLATVITRLSQSGFIVAKYISPRIYDQVVNILAGE
jgi:hypothetical protein